MFNHTESQKSGMITNKVNKKPLHLVSSMEDWDDHKLGEQKAPPPSEPSLISKGE